jgi:type II secretion system protein G
MNRSFPLAESSVLGLLAPPADLSCQSSPATSHSRSRRAGAFTLIELMVVVAVVAILAGLTLGGLGYVNRKSAGSRAQTEVAALSAAIESYKLDFGMYPSNATVLYAELTGDKTAKVNTNSKVFFEPPPGMVNTNVTPWVFQDPYGATYNYSTNPVRNIGFFDLYSKPPDAKSEADWIHN